MSGNRKDKKNMSFSADVKKELSQRQIERRTAKAELYGMLLLARSFSFEKILLQTGNVFAANRFLDLLRQNFEVVEEILQGGKNNPTYRVLISNEIDRKRIIFGFGYKKGDKLDLNTNIFKNEGNLNAFIRGAFLAAGNVSDPEKEYRIEFSFKDEFLAEQIRTLLKAKGFTLGVTSRAGKTVLYTKDSNTVEDILTFMGAGNETLNLIGVKVYKSVRNKSNRQNNCETSNILKTADAAYKQCKAIKKLKKKGVLETLPEELLEVANLRLNNPDMSLSGLCKLSSSHLTRSGFNHRMNKILEIAKEVK